MAGDVPQRKISMLLTNSVCRFSNVITLAGSTAAAAVHRAKGARMGGIKNRAKNLEGKMLRLSLSGCHSLQTIFIND